MSIERAQCGDVEIAFERFGSPLDPTVVLVMGLATQMIAWHDDFCAMIADEGFQVVRFDNRDIGLSTHFDEAGMPDLTPLMSGGLIEEAPYLLADMADDTMALVDALGIARVHVVGASMGGMIAQEVALRHPQRVLSLTSIFSTPGPRIGAPKPEAAAALLSPPATTEEEAGERAVAVYRVIGSPGYPLDEAGLTARARESFRRSNDPAGPMRQLAAIHVSGDRTERLHDLRVPTLVLHGEDDPLVQPEGGRATAEAVPGSRLVTFPGMGHDLPLALWPEIVKEIVAHARAAD
ncbi:alpha/beta fold hydrolase [Nocardioides albidus]|uniref:Alpha/beta fold hydrolase n=1 Tax=Nocardioides albidus TaxID=1517589 RepID=A0A5C4VMT4_9ACTN|nr:alpha/beta fold hydrolase [Nocardioides albidus]TNM36499.1 alpha/beta fold hydrolase [Nocardioides albidus]